MSLLCSFCSKAIPIQKYFDGEFLQLIVPGGKKDPERTYNFCDTACLKCFIYLVEDDYNGGIYEGEPN